MGEVVIRPAVQDDLDMVIGLINHYIRESPAIFELEPYTVEGRGDWFSQFRKVGRYRIFVAEDGGEVVGYACSTPLREKAAFATSVETSVYLLPARCGEGIGVRLYGALFEALGEEHVHRAYAAITVPNEASVALHRRFSFTEAGVWRESGRKFGRYHDVLWMQRGFG
jgi:phosphinothricin acetyltransferase